MGKVRKKFFSMLCIVLLVLTTIAPTLAFANETSNHSIKVDLGNKERTLNSAQGFIGGETGSNNAYIYLNYDYENKSFILDRNQYINFDISKKYQFTYQIQFNESGKSYVYLNKIEITGADILLMDTLLVPKLDSLTKKAFTNDLEDTEFFGINVILGQGDSYVKRNYNSYNSQDASYLIDKSANFNIDYLLSSNSVSSTIETRGRTGYLFTGNFSTLNEETQLSELKANASHIIFDTDANFISMRPSYNDVNEAIQKDSYITDGNYKLNYSSDDLNWSGNLTVNGDETISLPKVPTSLKVTVEEASTRNENLQLDYKIEATNGDYKVGYMPVSNIETTLLNGEEKVESRYSNIGQNYWHIPMGQAKSGRYKLDVSLDLEGKVFNDSAEFDYKSSWQDLKGTVITAEDSEGNLLIDAEAILYQINSEYPGSPYIEVAREGANTVALNGEIFIPDAYILNDQEYLIVVKSDTAKTAYIQKFVGQSSNNIHLKGNTLKVMKINTDDLTQINSKIILGDTTDSSIDIPIQFIEVGWKVSTDLEKILLWSGKNADGTVGYEFSGLMDDEKGIDFKNVDWFSHKPASHYNNATLSTSSGKELFKEVKSNYSSNFGSTGLYLNVEENDISYKGYVKHENVPEIFFGEYKGNVNHTGNVLTTEYIDEDENSIAINGSSILLTYVLQKTDEPEIVLELTSNSLSEIKLTEELMEGTYKLTLKNSSIDSNIVPLKMNSTFEVVEENLELETLPLSIPLEFETPYGKISEYSYGQMIIAEMLDDGYFSYAAHYYYDYLSKEYKLSYPNSIKPTAEYLVQVSLEIGNNSTQLAEVRKITGEEILELSKENPFTFSNNLKKIRFDLTGVLLNHSMEVQLRHSPYFSSIDLNLNYGNYEAYISPLTYSGDATFNDNKSRKFIDIPEFQHTANHVVRINDKDLAKVEFVRNSVVLPIFGASLKEIGVLSHSYDELITSYYIPKKDYKDLAFNVAFSDNNDTPWGYQLEKENEEITKDIKYNFSGEVAGDLQAIHMYNDGAISAQLNISADGFRVKNIYHAVKNPYQTYGLLAVEENPIREYYGLFNHMNSVPVTNVVKDEAGKIVFTSSASFYDLSSMYLNLPELKDGTYTLHVNIPTGPRKSMKLEKQFTVGAKEGAFVNIESPLNNSVTNKDIVEVLGSATKEAELTVVLKHGTTIVETKSIKATSEGKFAVTVTPKNEGLHIVEVTNGDVKKATSFIVDRSAPEKATNIQFAEGNSRLVVSWDGAADAIAYKVEVAEGTEAFKLVAVAQSSKTYTIANIKPGTTYKVRITSMDVAGNESVSEIASKVVAPINITEPGVPTNPGTPGTPGTGGGGSVSPPVEESNTVVIDDIKVNEQVKDTKTTSVEVTVPSPTEEEPTVKAEMSAVVLKIIADSGKTFVLKAGEISLNVPTEALKEIYEIGTGKTYIEINLDKDTKVPGKGTSVSGVYDFEIMIEKDGKTTKVSTFSKPIKVSIPVNASAVKNTVKLAAFFVNEKTNTLEYVGSKYANGKVTFQTNHFSKFVVVENNVTFKDIQKSWAKDYIESLASKTIIKGVTEDNFGPGDQITRAQFAVLLTRSLNLPKEEYQGVFADVSKGMTWSVREIEAANRAGIILGSNGKFNPNEKITRQQMASMIVRAIQYNDASVLKGVTGKVTFADEASISNYAKENVALAAELGIISGKKINGQQIFAPLDYATRAEASKMLYNLLETYK